MLVGVPVLELATLAAAPLVATHLGEFDYEVIKVEHPGQGDPTRALGNQRNGVGLMWKSISRKWGSITLNLRCAEGQALARRLAENVDVVIVNIRPQTLHRWGLDYDRLPAVNERIVMAHITGYGLTGPESQRLGFGTLGEAMSGFAHITRRPDGPPTVRPFTHADGQLLFERHLRGDDGAVSPRREWRPRTTHQRQFIDPSARLLEQTLLVYDQLGLVSSRAGNRWDISAPPNT